VLVAALVALACASGFPPVALAESFIVDSTADGVDAVPGDEFCSTAEGDCTLRAAIEEANSSPEAFDEIRFEEEVFEGRLADTIHPTTSLPTITTLLAIEGRGQCPTDAGLNGPCAGIEGLAGAPALVVEDADVHEGQRVEVTGLAISGAQTGIEVLGSAGFRARSNWFGVALDGTIAGNETGVLLDSESNGSVIGGEGTEHRNVFAGSAGNGLDIHGSSNVKVLGNYFGVEPDGVTPAPNGADAVEVASTKVLEAETEVTIEASGTEIGTRVSAAAAVSPLCDGGCNVISGAALHGVDLQADGGSEAPATSTYIAGNHIGLDAMGTEVVPNTNAGVNVGEAAHTTVGGPSSGEANRINGGAAAVLAGPVAVDLAVRGNVIGTDVSGAEPLTPPDEGIVVDSGELGSSALEAEITGNLIGMEGGVAILQRGAGAWILDNEIFGSQTGIRAIGSNSFYGNVIEGNLVEGSAANGILIENDFNEIVGNEILGAGAAGIWIQGALLEFGVFGNRIGGDTAADENVIDGSGGAAIEISNLEATGNEVARNRGTGNGGLFVDLVAASPGTEVGPNRGIEPPTFSTATQAGASGGALEGATVRVFRKQLAAAGELESFLGEAVADSAGGWELTYDAAIPTGTIIAATQTVEGATSELAVATTPGSEGAGGGGGGSVGGDVGGAFGNGAQGSVENEVAQVRPQTKIVKGRARPHTARFVFESDQPGSDFLCKLDGKPFDLCRSPKKYTGLAPGKHVFWVRAVDPTGRVDLSPAKKKFVVPG
jgi:CSLREA domain-containing protein